MVKGQIQGILIFSYAVYSIICNKITIVTKNAENASAGNRTRIYCLEGNNANLYTTDAVLLSWKWRNGRPLIDVKNFIPGIRICT